MKANEMNTISDKRQIRFLLEEDEHDRIRVAAALRRTTMAAFCREVVLREAEIVTQGVSIPSNKTTKNKRSKK